MRSDKALQKAFRRLQLPTSDDPRNVLAALTPTVPNEIRQAWDSLEYDDAARIAFAFENPPYAHLMTAGITLPSFREELQWLLHQFDNGLPEGAVVDIGAGAGVTAAVLALSTGRSVTACEPALGAASAIAFVAEAVGVDVRAVTAAASGLDAAELTGTSVAVAQSVLTYTHFGRKHDGPGSANERTSLVSLLSAVGEALVIQHTENLTNTTDKYATWNTFTAAMAEAGMYPVWESASLVSGHTIFSGEVPFHEMHKYARPKLCLRFSKSGERREAQTTLQEWLTKPFRT